MRKILTFSIFLIFFFSSCIKDKLDKIDGVILEPSLALPLGKAHFTVADLIQNDSILFVDQDGFTRIIFKNDSIVSVSLSQLLKELEESWLPNTKFQKGVGALELEDISKNGSVRLERIVDNFNDPNLRRLFRNSDGTSVVIPAFEEAINYQYDIESFLEFKYLKLIDGTVTVTVANGFDFPLQDLKLEVRDKMTGQLLETVRRNLLRPNESFSSDVNLKGKTINNTLRVVIPTIKSPGTSTVVPVHLDSFLHIGLDIKNVKIEEGEVKIPEYEFKPESQFLDFQTSANEKIEKIELENGILNYKITCSLNVPIELNMVFPGVRINGIPVKKTVNFTRTTSGSLDFSDADIHLDETAVKPYNVLEVQYQLKTSGSNNFVQFDSSTQVVVEVWMDDVEIEKITGNLGYFSRTLATETFDFGFDFSSLHPDSKPLLFENPNLKLLYQNSFGVPISADLKVSALGIFGKTANLATPKINLNYPKANQIGQTISDVHILNPSNSNIADLVAIFPKTIQYGGTIEINPGSTSLPNHVTGSSRLDVGVEMELPLKFRSEGVIYTDTFTNELLNKNPNEVLSALLLLDYKNRLPFSTKLVLKGVKDGRESLIISRLVLESAPVGTNGKVVAAKEDRIELTLADEQIAALFDSDALILQMELVTYNDGKTQVAIYNTDGLEIGLGLKAEFKF